MRMTKYIIVIMLFISTTCNAHISKQQALSVYKRLVKVIKLKRYPRLVVFHDKEINAGTNGAEIYITDAMLRFIRNKHELALVLGHELAHVQGNSNELQADIKGAGIMESAGYNKCLGIQHIKHMQAVFGDQGGDRQHPNWSVRYNAVKGGCQ